MKEHINSCIPIRLLIALPIFFAHFAIGATLDFNFKVWDENPGTGLRFTIAFKGNTNSLGKVIERFESRVAKLGDEEKVDVFRWYLVSLRFVEAEKVAEDLTRSDTLPKSHTYFALGLAKLFRGDYSQASRAMEVAAKAGSVEADQFQIYIASGLLRQFEGLKVRVRSLIHQGTINKSALAAAAAFSYCFFAGDQEMFSRFAESIDEKWLTTDESMREMYLLAAKKFENTREIERISTLDKLDGRGKK